MLWKWDALLKDYNIMYLNVESAEEYTVLVQAVSVRINEAFLPVCLIEYDDLVPSPGEGDFLMGKHLDPIANDIDASGG